MIKKSFISIGLVGIGSIFNAALGFAFIAVVARHLSIDDFGKYALLTSLLVSLSKLVDFGTTSLFVAKTISNEKSHTTYELYGVRVILLLISIPIAFLVLQALHVLTVYTGLIFLLGLLLYTINYTLFAIFQKSERYLELVTLNALPALIKGAFAALLFFDFIQLNIEQAFTIFALSLSTCVLLALILPQEQKLLKFDFIKAKLLLKEALAPGLAQVITESLSSISNAITKITADFASVGIYSIADKISNIFVLISYSIFTVLLPKNALRKKTKQGYDSQETILLTIGISLLAVLSIFFAKTLFPWFFNNKYNDSLPIFNILVFASALTAIHAFMENYFFVEGKTKFLSIIYITKLVVLLISAAILIPSYSITGLAWAQLIAASVALGQVYYFISQKKS